MPGIRKHHDGPRPRHAAEDQLLEVRNFGETTLTEVRNKLRDLGLHLGMRLPAVPPAFYRTIITRLPFGPELSRGRFSSRDRTRCHHATSTTWPKTRPYPSHQRALLRSLATALFLTERDAEFDENKPKVKGRIITTISKAKEVRPLVEKCITVARRGLAAEEAASQFGTNADRGSDAWKSWRKSDKWRKWNQAIAPSVAARRRCLQLLGDKQAVRVLFDEVAPRFTDRPGGYTRILRLAKPRLGDAGTRASWNSSASATALSNAASAHVRRRTGPRRRRQKEKAARWREVTPATGGWGRGFASPQLSRE